MQWSSLPPAHVVRLWVQGVDAGSAAMGLLRQLDAERSSPARPAALGLGLADLVARVGVFE